MAKLKSNDTRSAFVALFLLSASAIPRLYGLAERGFFYHDEAAIMRGARLYGGLLRWIVVQATTGHLFGLAAMRREIVALHAAGGTPHLMGRPLHEAFLAVLTAIFGSRDYVGLYFSAIMGILTILLLGYIGSKLYGTRIGLASGFLLALSRWHIQYSRSVLSQAFAILVAWLTFYWLWCSLSREGRRWLILAGLGASLSFMAHTSQFWIPVLVGTVHLGRMLRRQYHRPEWSRLALLGLSLITPLLAFELPFQVGLRVARTFGLGELEASVPVRTYFQQLYNLLTFHDITRLPRDWFFLPKTILNIEGLLFASLIALGMTALLWHSLKGDTRSRLVLTWVIVPVVVWTAFGVPYPRLFVPALPGFLLGTAVASVGSLDWLRRRRGGHTVLAIAAVALAITVVVQANPLWPLVSARSGWRLATRALQDYAVNNPGGYVAERYVKTYSGEILLFYLGALVKRNANDSDLFIGDVGVTLESADLRATWEQFRQQCSPIIRVPNAIWDGMIMQDAFGPGSIEFLKGQSEAAWVEVYDRRRCTP